MCPDPQLLSIYMDGELPSPWKEKLENHLAGCSVCREKLENFRQLRELFKKNTHQMRTIVERTTEHTDAERIPAEHEFIETAKDRVWERLQSKSKVQPKTGRYRSHNALWQRRLSIPLPAAAAAAIILALLTALWIRGGFTNQSPDAARSNFILASEEDMPGIIPAMDMNGVLQFLGSDGADILILRLPESRSFFRSGEPAIINAADYSRRRP